MADLKPKKLRLDELLVRRGLAEDMGQALRLVLAGDVRVDGFKACSVADKVGARSTVELKTASKYVSRGGYKLERALESFAICLDGLACVDLGASTGGFSDCMLQHGAKSVCAVDKGYGDFAWSLRQDGRVRLYERSDIRSFPAQDAGAPFDFAACDLSFISLRSYAAALSGLLKPESDCVVLVKPQFEVRHSEVKKGGVVADPRLHEKALNDALDALRGAGLTPLGLDYSPMPGRAGNIEFLLHARRSGLGLSRLTEGARIDVGVLVEQAHKDLEAKGSR